MDLYISMLNFDKPSAREDIIETPDEQLAPIANQGVSAARGVLRNHRTDILHGEDD